MTHWIITRCADTHIKHDYDAMSQNSSDYNAMSHNSSDYNAMSHDSYGVATISRID